ncbi:MAG: glutathione S-transferase [Hyphomicrobiaceae bacterium]|nr:glutathione S-transferase [Hyphomicrobiaceae bacterium]
MKLIQTLTAPNPRRVRIFLAEKGLAVPCEEMTLTADSVNAPDFVKMSPFRRVPVLVLDDGTTLTESMAICRYFEELHPEPALFGRDAKSTALIEMWSRGVEHGLFLFVSQAFRHLHPRMVEREVPQVAEWGEACKWKALAALDRLDAELSQRDYLAGDAFSVADITLLVAVDFMQVARIDRPANLTNLAAWHAKVSARPSASA